MESESAPENYRHPKSFEDSTDMDKYNYAAERLGEILGSEVTVTKLIPLADLLAGEIDAKVLRQVGDIANELLGTTSIQDSPEGMYCMHLLFKATFAPNPWYEIHGVETKPDANEMAMSRFATVGAVDGVSLVKGDNDQREFALTFLKQDDTSYLVPFRNITFFDIDRVQSFKCGVSKERFMQTYPTIITTNYSELTHLGDIQSGELWRRQPKQTGVR